MDTEKVLVVVLQLVVGLGGVIELFVVFTEKVSVVVEQLVVGLGAMHHSGVTVTVCGDGQLQSSRLRSAEQAGSNQYMIMGRVVEIEAYSRGSQGPVRRIFQSRISSRRSIFVGTLLRGGWHPLPRRGLCKSAGGLFCC